MQHKKKLIENMISLFAIQGTNYLLPLLTLPYLVRKLGPENFGLIAFSQAFIQLFVILTDYGFNLSVTKEISISRENELRISKIFSSVMLIKISFFIIYFLLFCVLLYTIDTFRANWEIYIISFGIVLGNVLFPIWLFQGLEQMKHITYLNILSRLIYAIGIFLFVKDQDDYLVVPLINTISSIIMGAVSLVIITRYFNIKIVLPTLYDIGFQLKEGWYIFLSTVAISLYTISNTFILGIFTNNTVVGYYSSAEKLINAASGVLTPISQTIYPYISKLVDVSKESAIIFLRKVIIIVGTIALILSFSIFIFSGFIVNLILGVQYQESVIVLMIIAFMPFFIALSNIFGIQTMLNFGYKKAFSNILVSGSVINLILALILVPLFAQIGTAIGAIIAEMWVVTCMLFYLKNKKIKLWR